MEFDGVPLEPASDSGVWRRHRVTGRNRVLLREPETCPVCEERFLSLYPLRVCSEHDGLDGI